MDMGTGIEVTSKFSIVYHLDSGPCEYYLLKKKTLNNKLKATRCFCVSIVHFHIEPTDSFLTEYNIFLQGKEIDPL